jgi:hypothetical protein
MRNSYTIFAITYKNIHIYTIWNDPRCSLTAKGENGIFNDRTIGFKGEIP